MTTRNTSCTTTGLSVGDTEGSRTPLQADAMPNPATSEGQKPLAPKPGAVGINVGMTTAAQVNVGPIKPVDRRTLAGSTPGDFRKGGDYAAAAMQRIANPPAPREQMGEAKMRSSKLDSPAPASFPGNLADSDSGN